MPRSFYQRMEQPADDSLSKLLGPLEAEVMDIMWGRQSATVRDVTTTLNTVRPVAYTTVMTIMNNLAEKGLLKRTPLDKRTYLFDVVLSHEAFLQRSSERVVRALIEDFGDLVLTQFAQALEDAPPEQQARVKRRLKEQAARARKAGETPHAP
ncbi:MAG: BlaI/MecI/CopY family transcriptional regulator [Chloroflexota bacterium]|nr:BlaI/MecI/CopY family transcriptional regulator [Chloroflexota bacterium]